MMHLNNVEIVNVAKFNGTLFMSTSEFNSQPSSVRRNINGNCYLLQGKWRKVGFRKPTVRQAA